jgi:hypothetical protein
MVIWVIVGLGAFVISVGGKTAIFIGVFGIMPSLEDHQVHYQVVGVTSHTPRIYFS